MEYLVIRFAGPSGGVAWQVVDAHGACLADRGEGPLEQAAAVAGGRKVVLLVPAREVFRDRLNLPARGRRAAVRAARYALEDRIACDVEDLHFVAGAISGDQLEVAAVERGRLSAWLDQCSAVGLEPAAIYGEGDTLPELPNAAVALLEPDAVLLRGRSGQFVSAEPAELAGLVDILCAEPAGEDGAPFRLVLYCEPALEDGGRQMMANLAGREVELRLLEQGVLAQLAAQAFSGRAVNLLQGKFKPRDDRLPLLREFSIGVLAATLLYPAFLALDGWRAQRDYRVTAEAVDTRLERLMPDVAPSANLRAEMGRRVASADLSAAAKSDEFLRLVDALARSGGDRVRVLGLNYGGGSAQVQVRAADLETLDEARRRLRSDGYAVVIQTAAPDSNGSVMGELDVRNDPDR